MARKNKTRRPWHQQPDETPAAYNGFVVYCSLPSGQRSARKAYSLIYEPAKMPSTAPKYFQAWMSANNWVERSEAYDREIREKYLDDEALRTGLELQAFRERQLETVRRMQRVASGVIDKWLGALERDEVEIDSATLNAAMRAIESAANAEARALGVGHVLALIEYNEPDAPTS